MTSNRIFNFDEIKETCLRIKDYLGDKYISFHYRYTTSDDIHERHLTETTFFHRGVQCIWIRSR